MSPTKDKITNGNWAKTKTVKNDYLYNSKELNTDLGLNWSDYGARFYDAAIGRFTGVDPISDQFAHVSTYNYAENSPIVNIDLWGLQAVWSGSGLVNSPSIKGSGSDYVKNNPSTAAAIAVGFIAAPIGFALAAEAGPAVTIAFIANEIKDEAISQATGGWSDILDVSKNLKNLAEYGIRKLDIGGGAKSKYTDALNIDSNSESGFKGNLSDFVKQTGGKAKFSDVVVDNPQFNFLEDAGNILEEGGTITVRGTMSNPYFNKIIKGKAAGVKDFNVSEATKISNEGFKRTDGESITGQMYEVTITQKQ